MSNPVGLVDNVGDAMPMEPAPSSLGGKLTRALLWTSGLAAGLFLLTRGHGPGQRRSLERAWRAQCREDQRERALHDAIIGSTRHSIAAVFGPPRTWLGTRAGTGLPPGLSSHWSATTWYYAMPGPSRAAMAIRFDDDRAVAVDFIHIPTEAGGSLRSP